MVNEELVWNTSWGLGRQEYPFRVEMEVAGHSPDWEKHLDSDKIVTGKYRALRVWRQLV